MQPGSRNKKRIRRAAVALFAEKGYQATSIRDVAAAAGVSLAMINYHFQSKELLFLSIIAQFSLRIRKSYTLIQHATKLSPLDKALLFFEMTRDLLVNNECVAKMIVQELLPENTILVKQKVQEIKLEHQHQFEVILSSSIKEPTLLTFLYHAVFGGLINLWQSGQLVNSSIVSGQHAGLTTGQLTTEVTAWIRHTCRQIQ